MPLPVLAGDLDERLFDGCVIGGVARFQFGQEIAAFLEELQLGERISRSKSLSMAASRFSIESVVRRRPRLGLLARNDSR